MSANEQFEYDSLQDNQTIIRYLQALIEGFEKGKIMFNSDDEKVELYPNNLLQFNVKVRKKDDKSKLSMKISWKDLKKREGKDKILITS